jgi:hypothetical protein
MKEIPLTRGHIALVDDEDYERLAPLKWCALVKEDGRAYAVHYKVVAGKVTATKMHRLLCAGELVDHKNGNGLDNRKENLRSATKNQNMWNRRSFVSKSGFKGVSLDTSVFRTKPWRAVIYQYGKRQTLGHFADPKEAARAYDEAAATLYGEFAATNKSLGLLP